MTDETKLALSEVTDPLIQEICKYYDPELAAAIRLSPREIERMRKYATKLHYGSASWMPLICTGEDSCVYKRVCPNIEHPPLGYECPWERLTIDRWYTDYVTSLEIDIADKVERSQVMELVEADVLNARANAVLSTDGFIMNNPVGVDPDTGATIFRKEEHIAMLVKEKAHNRRDKILKAFIATRNEKVKAMKGGPMDPTEYLAKLREKMAQVQQVHEAEVIKDAPVPAVEKKEPDQAGGDQPW